MFCQYCGAEIAPQAVVCMKCGCPTNGFRRGGIVNLGEQAIGRINNELDDFDRKVSSAFDSTNSQQQSSCNYNGESYQDQSESCYCNPPTSDISPKSGVATLILLLLFAQFGAHRFYIGRTGSAVGMLLLFVLGYALVFTTVFMWRCHCEWMIIPFAVPLLAWFVWWVIDLIKLLSGKMRDNNGLRINL